MKREGQFSIRQRGSNIPILWGLTLVFSLATIDFAKGKVVRLVWDPNTESNITGYYVYRSDSTEKPLFRLNYSMLLCTDYRDESVEAGHTYYYSVTAVDKSGDESALSRPLKVSLPVHDSNSTSSSLIMHTPPNLVVRSGEMVILSGSGWTLKENCLTYLWSQLSGLKVILLMADKSEASFLAPAVTTEVVLSFALTVTDSDGFTSIDFLKVRIHPR